MSINGEKYKSKSNVSDHCYEGSSSDETEEESSEKETAPWDVIYFPTQLESSSMRSSRFFNITVWILKLFIYGLLFIIVLCSSIGAKSAVLLAVSQLQNSQWLLNCSHTSESEGRESLIEQTQNIRIKWTWCLIFIFLVPECIGVLNTLWHYLFRTESRIPKKRSIIFMLLIDTLHTIGLVLLTFIILPEIDAVQSAAIFCCLCFVPGLLNLLSRNKETRNLSTSKLRLFIIFDVLALTAQVSGMILRPIIQNDINKTSTWIFPITFILCSIRWWSNFMSLHSKIGLVRFLSSIKEDLQPSQHIVQGYSSLWRMFIFITGALVVNIYDGIDVQKFFSPRFTAVYDIKAIPVNVFLDYFTNIISQQEANSMLFYVFAIQTICAMMVYQCCKFAYRTHMHQFGFAFPISLASLGTLCLIKALCVVRKKDICASHAPDHLFCEEEFENWSELLSDWYVWFWPTWLVSQIWITMHLWTTENERLALAERIFSTSTYDSLMIDQCLAMNRRTQNENMDEDDEEKNKDELSHGDLKFEAEEIGLDTRRTEQDFDRDDMNVTINRRKDRVTRIYACATMWHEEKNEMNRLVGSILRLDKNQSAMGVCQKHYKVHLKDYYELETHIFFDDAFCCMHDCVDPCNHDENETQVNHYVMTLVETVQKNVENLRMYFTPPTKYPTPYGGRLVWKLPGETQLIVHLKDKNKIRHRKRWSQVMYMYYLLGYRLIALPIEKDRKEIIAENTYILTLDGDIDFRPAAVKVLVDLMKKDRSLGAACGRIHPVGSGPMVWFQKFEYAIGHWLQKSTEHTIGCVLCSPGCFSLFRATALKEPNVMAKYATKSSKARHYIQYDQGEDRWLCTLLLQVGSRVEYSAASDAYTHAPEFFTEFYMQRRRWIPSTVANIIDLLTTARETRRVNDDISWLYIAYQWILIGSTLLGPGTIFLMLVGAFVAAFHIDNWTSFWYNLIPIGVFVGICFTCKERTQLIVAEIISVIYGLVMIIVLVGIMLQIAEDGWLAPSSLLVFVVACQMIIAGLLHPQEVSCLLYGIIYYISVPSMYMLLIIFSVFNVHNVTWGTRDSKKPSTEEQRFATGNLSKFIRRKGKKPDKIQKGTLEFFLGDLFKCICCIHSGTSDEEKRLIEINESLLKINKRLNLLDRQYAVNTKVTNVPESSNMYTRPLFPMEEPIEEEVRNEEIELQHMIDKNDHENESYKDFDDDESDVLTQVSTTFSRDNSNFLISPYWLQDERMRRGEVDFLSNPEEEFWKDLIGKYLRPIETDEQTQSKIVQELISCRDAYLLKFFMINAVFVLIVFLMQLNKHTLHLQWPLGMKYNVTYDSERNEKWDGERIRFKNRELKKNFFWIRCAVWVFIYQVQANLHLCVIYAIFYRFMWKKEYLRLEPIGCLFIATFITILGIQFFAMLIHRFDTLSHVLAKAKLPFCTKVTSSEDSTFEKHADEIAQEIQRIAEDDELAEFRRSTAIFSRKIRGSVPMESSQGPLKMLGNWARLFRKKLRDPNASARLSQYMSSRISKSAFERRRSTILEERKQTQKSNGIYDDADNLRSLNNQTFQSQPEPLNVNQFQYDNQTFKRDEDI